MRTAGRVTEEVAESWEEAWARAEALFYLGHAMPTDLPLVAARALSAGRESEHLVLLAGEPSSGVDPRDLRDLFGAALVELGRPRMRPQEALGKLVRFEARRIVEGTTDPATGARNIARLPWSPTGEHLEPSPETVVFDMLDDEWTGGWGRGRDALRRAICDEAQALLD